MWLDNRLRHVVDEIDASTCTIDVGTDHGKVILTLLKEGRCAKGIASDISSESLSKARELAIKMNIPLDTRCGDGLKVVSHGEVDTAVIAGMGGKEIVKILGDIDWSVDKLVLVPHRDTYLTRLYLLEHGYKIDKDYMIQEGKFFYSIIVATRGYEPIDERTLYVGKNDCDNIAFQTYISYRIGVLEGILEKTDNGDIRRELDILRSI